MSRIHSSVPLKSKARRKPVPVMTQTIVPSVTGDGDDMFCLRCLLLPVLSGRFHSTSPLTRLTAQSDRWLPSASATFRKIVSPQMTGVAPLHCGSWSFQAMFSVGLHLTGRFFSGLTPSPAGPRHAGQLADATAVVARLIIRINADLRMRVSGERVGD